MHVYSLYSTMYFYNLFCIRIKTICFFTYVQKHKRVWMCIQFLQLIVYIRMKIICFFACVQKHKRIWMCIQFLQFIFLHMYKMYKKNLFFLHTYKNTSAFVCVFCALTFGRYRQKQAHTYFCVYMYAYMCIYIHVCVHLYMSEYVYI